MNVRQEKSIKATELSNTMQCKVDSEIWKLEGAQGAVGIGRG